METERGPHMHHGVNVQPPCTAIESERAPHTATYRLVHAPRGCRGGAQLASTDARLSEQHGTLRNALRPRALVNRAAVAGTCTHSSSRDGTAPLHAGRVKGWGVDAQTAPRRAGRRQPRTRRVQPVRTPCAQAAPVRPDTTRRGPAHEAKCTAARGNIPPDCQSRGLQRMTRRLSPLQTTCGSGSSPPFRANDPS